MSTDISYYPDMEESALDLGGYWAILKRRRYQFLVPAALITLLSLLLAFGLPAVYRSTATILIEQQDIPRDLVKSTVTSFASEQIQVITQRVMTAENINRVAEKYKLYGQDGQSTKLLQNELVEKFNDDVNLELESADVIDPRSGRPTQATIAFTLSFDNTSPTTAKQVASELVDMYLNENLRARSMQATGASDFLKGEADALNAELLAKEQKIARFKELNGAALPELYQLNLTSIERTQRELSDVNMRIQELQKREIELASSLSQLDPSAYMTNPNAIMSDTDRLKALKAEYRKKSALYKENHPDVIRLRGEIASLEASGVSAAGSGTDSTSSNPAYLLLASQLKATRSEINSLGAKKTELGSTFERYQNLIQRAPIVEQEYKGLLRDYETANSKYQEIRAKQREADLSKSLEQGRMGERFTVIDPPNLPSQPDSPNRPAITFLGLVLAMGSGLGLVVLMESMDSGIRGERALTAIMGAAPLVVIPYLRNSEDKKRRSREFLIVICSAIAMLLLAMLCIHVFYKPLDIIWITTLKEFGSA
jgi:polysaccharide chain length determinant protein (PEP-CTERM system associated)